MKRKVQLFIEGIRVDFFDDEEITVNSSIQTIKDISKVFNDYSQTFSVPASENNNQIFQHFYNSEVILRNNGFVDHQIKRSAELQIDGFIFREGKVSLEKATLKDGQVYNYQVTFYGELTALKDLFGEINLNELDWSEYNHTYDYSNVKLRIEDWQNDYDVRYPLISSERYWQYDNPTTPSENIDTPAGAIVWTELSPALKLRRVLEKFEETFNIEFTGSWLSDTRFQDAYLLFKNSNAYTYTTPPYTVDFQNISVGTPPPYAEVDLTANTIRLTYVVEQYPPAPAPPFFFSDIGYHEISVFTSGVSNLAVTYYIDVYVNGQLESTVTAQGNVNEVLHQVTNTNNVGLDQTVKFYVRSEAPLFMLIAIQYRYVLINGIEVTYSQFTIQCDSITTQTLLNLSSNAPEITVAKFFSSVLKQFNLTCYGEGNNKYRLETIEEWYDTGTIYDITEFVDVDTIDIERIPLFKRIEFKYQECKSITNQQFLTVFGRQYGDLLQSYQYEGGEYKIEIDFELPLFQKFTNSQVRTAYLLDENLDSYVPKPIIIYQTGVVQSNPTITANWYLTDLLQTDLISSYADFGTELINQGDFKSLTWGVEVSTRLESPIQDSLYGEYYSDYIENLYNFRNRRVKVKAVLPISILTALDLNDRVVIRDKRYIIDTLVNNLTSGESTLELLLDFRYIEPEVTGDPPIRPIKPPIFVPDFPVPPAVDNCVEFYVRFPKECIGQPCTITDVSSPAVPGVTITPNVITEPQYIEICIPDNPTPIKPVVNERPYQPKPSKEVFLITEATGIYLQQERGANRVITLRFEFDCGDKVIVQEQQFTQQLEIIEP